MAFRSEYIIYYNLIQDRYPPLNFLFERIQDINSYHFSTINRILPMPLMAVQTTLSNIINETRGENSREELALAGSPAAKNLLYPDQPFYFNPHPWLPATIEYNGDYCSLPVFYLMNNLEDELDQAVPRKSRHPAETLGVERNAAMCPGKSRRTAG